MNKVIRYSKHFFKLIKYILCRFYCFLFNVKNDDVWLISERGVDARDNGYHFYKYIRKEHPEINIVYVIKSDSSDFKKISALGKYVEFGSWKHYILFITAGKLISTHIIGYSPDGTLFQYLDKKNLLKLNGKRITLKHGITKDNMDFYNMKIDLFVCGAYPEYLYVTKTYLNLKNKAKYTGFARYDNLINNKKSKTLLLMPTFRSWLIHDSNDEFKKSKYYIFYLNLINSKRLSWLLEKYNYDLIFYPHFEMQKYLKLFECSNKRVKLASFSEFDVQQLLIDCNLLITDFSSVFFDFAYMHKPMIFYQFDKEEYRGKHYKEGYFSYERDGFGPVVYEEDILLDELERILKNNCKISEEYDTRIKGFFKYSDQKNCERIYDEIMKL